MGVASDGRTACPTCHRGYSHFLAPGAPHATPPGCRTIAHGHLAVSAQVLMAGRGKEPVEFGDGVLTLRGTFQKFFEQAELKAYLEEQLQTEAIPAGIGTFYLFKDELRRQQFLANRFRRLPLVP